MSFTAERLRKSYGTNVAVDEVSLSVQSGQVHGLVGANGAGKSTLVKMISGALKPDAGQMSLGSWTGSALTPRIAQKLGISTIHQDPALAPSLGLLENLVLGHEAALGHVFLSPKKQRSRALVSLERVGLMKPLSTKAGILSPADQQMLEIAKALMLESQLVIMDEPTAALGDSERQRLFSVVRDLRSSGVGVIYISHHLDEVLALCDVVTVMRDGRAISCQEVAGLTEDKLVDDMIGHNLTALDGPARETGPVVLSVREVTQISGLQDVSFDLHQGEVLGVAGLVGSGRSRLARVLFGIESFSSGQIMLFGNSYRPKSPLDAIRQGVGLVPEDRKKDALLMQLSLAKNISIVRLATKLRFWLNLAREQRIARDWITRLAIHPPSPRVVPAQLSGGNQQKVVIARWINQGARVVIFDEPGQGVDVGAREQILRVIHDLAEDGVAVLLISQEIEELRQISDRVIVMRKCRIAGEVARQEICDEVVIPLAMGTAPRITRKEEFS